MVEIVSELVDPTIEISRESSIVSVCAFFVTFFMRCKHTIWYSSKINGIVKKMDIRMGDIFVVS